METTLQIRRNCLALQNCFNCIQSMIDERKKRGETIHDTYTLSLAGKMVYERLEKEKRLFHANTNQDTSFLLSTFTLAAPPPTEDEMRPHYKEIKDSLFYKGLWGRAYGNETKN